MMANDKEKSKEKSSDKKGSEKAEPIDVQVIDVPHKKSKKGLFTYIGIAAVVVVLVAAIVIFVAVSNAYKKPVNNLIKGVNKADTKIIMEAVFPEDILTYRRINAKKNGSSWESYIASNNELVKLSLESMNFKKARCSIVAKEKISGSNLEKIKEFYMDSYDAEIKNAYRLEVNMTFKTGGGDETPSGWVCVVNVKDEGWKFCPEYSEKHFDFIDAALNFQ